MRSVCDRIIRWGLAALIAFTPFAFGTVERWSIAIMEWGIVTLVLVFGVRVLWPGDGASRTKVRRTGVEIPLLLFLLYAVLQTVPVPLAWLEILSPGSVDLYDRADLEAVTRQEGSFESRGAYAPPPGDPLLNARQPERRPISINAGKTLERTRLLAVFVALFYLVAIWCDRDDRIVFLLSSVTVVGFLVAVQGIVQYMTWNGRIFWIRRVPPSSPFGPFVNHNHFAGYVEMVIPVAISMALYVLMGGGGAPSDRESRSDSLSEGPVRWRLPDRREGRWSQGGLALFAAVILGVSLVLAFSRGGLLATSISGLILIIALHRRIGSRRLIGTVAIGVPLIVAGMITWIGTGEFWDRVGSVRRIQSEASFRSRIVVWGTMIERFPRFARAGTGLGTFEESFAQFTPAGSTARWDKAHNDYLQIVWEMGIPGGVLILLGVWTFLRQFLWPGLRSRGDPLDIFRIGIAVALISIALHSFVDFNLQIGANGFLFALLSGLLISLTHRQRRFSKERPMLVKESADAG